jgi:hypothetical protein
MLFFLPSTIVNAMPNRALEMSVEVSASMNALVDTAGQHRAESKLGLTKVFAGGRFVIQITRANGGIADYMDVNAGDLLATYEFDANGNMRDRVIWSEAPNPMKPGDKARIAAVLKSAFKQETTYPWLRSNVEISIMQARSKYAIYIQPMSIEKEKRAIL